jgi:acyl dehydratase
VRTVSIVDGFIAEAITRTSSYSLNYGHDKIRYLRPVYPGDTLQATVEVTAVEEKNEEWGLLTVEALAHNQDDELVLVNINKLLIRRRSAM